MPKKVKIELDFDTGDFVYIVTDPDKVKRQVVFITFSTNAVTYHVRSGGDDPTEHQAFELEEFKDSAVK